MRVVRYHGPVRGVVIASYVLMGACFDPTPPAGAICGDNGACPSGQRCDQSKRCVPESNLDVDAATDATDAPIDTDIDAGIDAPPDAAGPVVVSFQMTMTNDTEATGLVGIVLTLSSPAPAGISATVTVTGGSATRPADFTVPASTVVTFTTGASLQMFPITVVSDNVDENDETVTLALTAGAGTVVGAITTHTLTIADDDDAPTVQWDPAEMNTSAPEGGAGAMTPFMWRVVLSAPSSRMITVPVTFTGTASSTSDYTIATGDVPVTFVPGTSSKVVRITVLGDPTVGPNENVIMTLGAPTNATLGANTVRTHTLVNDD